MTGLCANIGSYIYAHSRIEFKVRDCGARKAGVRNV